MEEGAYPQNKGRRVFHGLKKLNREDYGVDNHSVSFLLFFLSRLRFDSPLPRASRSSVRVGRWWCTGTTDWPCPHTYRHVDRPGAVEPMSTGLDRRQWNGRVRRYSTHPLGRVRYSVYFLYWYKSTTTDPFGSSYSLRCFLADSLAS